MLVARWRYRVGDRQRQSDLRAQSHTTVQEWPVSECASLSFVIRQDAVGNLLSLWTHCMKGDISHLPPSIVEWTDAQGTSKRSGKQSINETPMRVVSLPVKGVKQKRVKYCTCFDYFYKIFFLLGHINQRSRREFLIDE